MIVKGLEKTHWEEVKKIYEMGVATRLATFEIELPDWEEWDKKHLQHSRLICEIEGRVGAWIAIRQIEDDCVCMGVAEISVYVHPEYKGIGLGLVLMEHLFRHSEENGIWTLQAQVFEENRASIRLHEKSGFRKVGYRENIGQLDGKWQNTILFERRSKNVGI